MLLYHLFGDMGLSIIVLTLFIRLLLFPLTLKQLKSTKATQAIQPLIADVRKKYSKDQKAQYEAIQAIYKEYGVNPASGCLPLLIQLPVLYGLFFALNTVLRTPNLANINQTIYPFLPHFSTLPSVNLDWFTFLNPHWYISLGSPDPTHILPFVTFFFALNFPAGLALYWTTTSLFSMVQQYFVTGWGSLTVMPPFLQNLLQNFFPSSGGSKGDGGNKAYSGDQRKETRLLQQAREAKADDASTNGRAERNTQSGTNANGSSSSARRRPRNNSASARRRGNTPKRNVSRS